MELHQSAFCAVATTGSFSRAASIHVHASSTNNPEARRAKSGGSSSLGVQFAYDWANPAPCAERFCMKLEAQGE